MTDYVIDNTVLPGPKADLNPIPDDGDPTKYLTSAEFNTYRDAINSLRAFVTALTPGTYTLTTVTVDAHGRISALVSGSAGLTDGDKGDIIVGSSGTTLVIDTGVVSNAKLATMPANTFKLNNTAGVAAPIDGTIAQVLALLQIKVGGLGDGSSGAAVFDGSTAVSGYSGPVSSIYTATQENAFTNVTFSAGVILDQTGGGAQAGFRLFISGVATVTSGTATIRYNGNSAVLNAAGAALGNNAAGNNAAAGVGGIQNAGSNGNTSANWSQKVKGGQGGAGGASPTAAGGTGATVANTYAASLGDILTWGQAVLGRINLNTPGIVSGGGSGGAGGGTVGIASGGGSGGGGGVGVVAIGSMAGAGTLVVEAKGGAGGGGVSAVGSNAAGGGGGGGGVLFVAVGTGSQPSNLTLQCPGGAGGAPQGTGAAGSTGLAGTVRFYPLGAV